jgi:RNA polymerase sigma-70 factor, ECF subfamily
LTQRKEFMVPNPVVEHIPRLRRYARALTRDRHAGDDLVQDTLERAVNKLHLWRPGSDMRAWLFSIMHNVFVNQRRSLRLEVESATGELPEAAVQATQFDRIVLAEVEKALLGVCTEQREVLLLVAVEQMSYEEAAKALAIPIGTVMSRLSRARERLRRLTGYASLI